MTASISHVARDDTLALMARGAKAERYLMDYKPEGYRLTGRDRLAIADKIAAGLDADVAACEVQSETWGADR